MPAASFRSLTWRPCPIVSATVGADRRSVILKVDGRREIFVHELRAEGVRSAAHAKLDHPDAYYTLNRIPKTPPAAR